VVEGTVKRIFVIYVAVVILQSLVPLGNSVRLDKISVFDFRADHIVHVLLFIPWAYFCIKLNKNLPLWLLWGIMFAIVSEGLQYWLSYRSFNISDMLANVIGVIAGLFIFFLY